MTVSEIGNVEMFIGFFVSLACSIFLVLTTKWHGKFTLDGTAGVQKFHTVPTPRIGGLAIFLGLVFACTIADGPLQALFLPILMAGLPAFCFGTAEDLTKRISVRARLFATMASGVIAWSLTGASISYTGLWGVDYLLSFVPVAVLFTAFAVGGVANAVNIIDGFNGLASGTVILCLAALGMISLRAGDVELAQLCFIVAAVTVGFFVVNFPLGKLFLGDGGAYLLGFMLAWIAVTLPLRNPSISVWAPLLACAYPIFETLFTIMRRMWARSHPGEPDSHHLHSLVKVAISVRFGPKLRPELRNASVSPFCWVIALVPAVFAVIFASSTWALVISCAISFGVYFCVYCYLATAARSRGHVAARSGPAEKPDDEEVTLAA